MSHSASTRGRLAPDADADTNSDAHLYSQYAVSPPASPQRPPPPPPRHLHTIHDDTAANAHRHRQDHVLADNPQPLQDRYPDGRRLPRNKKPPLPVPSAFGSSSMSPRLAAPSPLSTSQQHDSQASNQAHERFHGMRSLALGQHNQPAAQTAFDLDSSNPSSPEEEISSLSFPNVTNDTRSVSEPLTSNKPTAALRPFNRAMEGLTVAGPASVMKPMPRNSSVDTAISGISTHSSSDHPLSSSLLQTPDIAHLIKTAGSPEAVIKYLLKEKQSQSQQNTQLWRLVDKQRAMILGLNKDLEAALKDKERYRRKLKEFIANPSVLRATTGRPSEGGTRDGGAMNRVDAETHHGAHPDSPVLELDSQKDSPVDFTMAPYPITPPADRPQQAPATGVAEILDPAASMPKHQEHALNSYDHEVEDMAEEDARSQQGQEKLRELPSNASLPPSRSLPSEPPNVPPPQLPPGSESPPRQSEATTRSAAPSRKAPPAPLQLPKGRRKTSPLPAGEASDSESDYDDILNVRKASIPDRGRRRTRGDGSVKENDKALPEQTNVPEIGRHSASIPEIAESSPLTGDVRGRGPEAATASLTAVLNGERSTVLAPPAASPGLPLSPRPTKIAPPSPLTSPHAGFPLSPRPPRQPIPLPPNTPLAASSTASSMEPAQATQGSPLAVPQIRTVDSEQQLLTEEGPGPAKRTQIYKGLVTDDYPDLLLPPNALPSIDIKVASSRMKPSRASLLSLTQLEEDPVFTLAIISRSDHGELWRVEKDTSSLSKLDQRMKQCQAFTAKTPEKSLFSGHSPAKLDARRKALETYLGELLNTLLDEATALELCKYLSINTLPPNADETGTVGKLTPDHSANYIGPDGKPARSGYLTKKGKNFGGWKVRFFVLDGPQLKYYETPGGPHLGTIKLQGAQIGKQSQSGDNQSPALSSTGEELDNQYRHAFLVLEPKKKDSTSHVKHVLCAENDGERDLWVESLLQWIESRDTDDIESPLPKPGAHDKQHKDTVSKGKKPSQTRAASQQDGESAPLIGVRYDATNAGDAPQHGGHINPRPKTGPGLPEHPSLPHLGVEASSPGQPKIISGPKDLQLISDASSWGNRLGLPQPSLEDKKQRKRSFFGFGPRTRSSSDGQESLAGSESGSITVSQGPVHHVGQVFGASLAEASQFHRPKDVDVPLPSVVYRCIQFLEAKNALNEEGIFRLSGSNIVIKQIRERFNHESDINLITDEQYYDIHAVASLLKLYLRELPSTILTRDLHLDFLNTTEISDRDEKVATMADLAQRLPEANLTLLKYLISFLIRVINNSDVNKMTVRNVGIVFSPTLNIPAPVFAAFLQNYEGIFGIEPEEYELSTAHTTESGQRATPEAHSRADGRPRYDAPARPSTSSGSASPHTQPRMESMRGTARSTPTPPLVLSRAPARESPTWSLSGSGRPAYEPAHLVQPGAGGVAGAAHRPAFETNHGLEQASAGAGGIRAPAAYDRGLYQMSNSSGSSTNLAVNENRGNKKRRESSLYVSAASGAHGRPLF